MRTFIRIVFSALLANIIAGCGSTHMMRPSTPEPVIMKRASQQPPPRWMLPLGPALVEDMRLLDQNRLLVGLKNNDITAMHNLAYLLVDAKRGEVLWRHERAKNAAYHLLFDSVDLILFHVTKGQNASLVALDAKTGTTAWTSDLGSGRITAAPDTAGGRIIAVKEDEKNTIITAFRLKTGDKLWQREVASGSRIPPLIAEEVMWLFSIGIECLALKDGATRWARTDLQPAEGGPPPQYEGDRLLVMLEGDTLSGLDGRTGRQVLSAALPMLGRYTNIYPYGGRIYVRGISKEPGRRFKLLAVDAATGKLPWTYEGVEPSVSNLIESDGRLYFGTATSLAAVDERSGREIFSAQVEAENRVFPVHIRKKDNKVIFIGELVVAAYDASTGKEIYRHVMTPLSNEAHLQGLDRSLAYFRKTAGLPSGSSSGGLSSVYAAESRRYQNSANTYHKLEHKYYAKGDYYRSERAGIQADLNRTQAANMATISFAYALSDAVEAWLMHSLAKSMEGAIQKQELLRRSILISYGLAETAEYVYRPHLAQRSVEDAFVGVSVIRLKDGKRKDIVLSPQYVEFGLWNTVDFEKGVVYHHGIGMDPAQYRYSEQSVVPFVKMRTIDSHLIAAPVDIPR